MIEWDLAKYQRQQFSAQVTTTLIRMHAPALNVCVQAGGHRGLWPLYLAAHFKQVYTFEPLPDNFTVLELLVPANVVATKAALGDERRLVSLHEGKKPTHTGMYYVVREDGDCQMVRVDDLHLSALDALVLDIEGAEFPALRGAEDSIRQFKPLIVVEKNPEFSARFGYQFEDLDAWVLTHGYLPSAPLWGKDVYYAPKPS